MPFVTFQPDNTRHYLNQWNLQFIDIKSNFQFNEINKNEYLNSLILLSIIFFSINLGKIIHLLINDEGGISALVIALFIISFIIELLICTISYSIRRQKQFQAIYNATPNFLELFVALDAFLSMMQQTHTISKLFINEEPEKDEQNDIENPLGFTFIFSTLIFLVLGTSKKYYTKYFLFFIYFEYGLFLSKWAWKWFSVALHLLSFGSIYFFYLQEKQKQMNFLKLYLELQAARKWEYLMKNSIPSSFVIVQLQNQQNDESDNQNNPILKPLLVNKHFKKIFDIQNEDGLLLEPIFSQILPITYQNQQSDIQIRSKSVSVVKNSLNRQSSHHSNKNDAGMSVILQIEAEKKKQAPISNLLQTKIFQFSKNSTSLSDVLYSLHRDQSIDSNPQIETQSAEKKNLNQIQFFQFLNFKYKKSSAANQPGPFNSDGIQNQFYNSSHYRSNDREEDEVQQQQKDEESENCLIINFQINIIQLNKETYYMVMIQDQSEKIKNLALQEANQYKDELLALVSHDLKTPLNSILMSVRKAKQISNVQDIQEVLNQIFKASTMLQTLIFDMLDYSQIKVGKFRIVEKQFAISETLQEMKELFQDDFSAKKIQLILNIDQDVDDIMINNDQRRLKQVLANLLSNAIQYTEKGFIKVTVKFSDDQKEVIRFQIQDTGTGMPKTVVSRLFQSFSTFDHQLGSNKNGIGLGLVIALKLVNQLGPQQSIEVESVTHYGSCFSFFIFTNIENAQTKFSQKKDLDNTLGLEQIPQIDHLNSDQSHILKLNQDLADSSEIPMLINQTNSLQPYNSGNLMEENFFIYKHNLFNSQKIPSIHILLVDDSLLNIEALEFCLEEFYSSINALADVKIHRAFSGEQAIQKTKTQFFKMIFMDINLPGSSGIEACQAIQKLQFPSFSTIIAVSGEELNKDEQLEFDYVISQPISIERLQKYLSAQSHIIFENKSIN